MSKEKKIKIYVLTVSLVFPTKHSRAGEPTYFKDHIVNAIYEQLNPGSKADGLVKLHTIRANYPLWKKRIEEVQKGNAVLSIRYWSGKPYNSNQVEIVSLDYSSGIGIQQLKYSYKGFSFPNIYSEPIEHTVEVNELANNDGLSFKDFKEWFKGYNLKEPMAIIQFTNFRY